MKFVIKIKGRVINMVKELISNEEMSQYMTDVLGLKLLHEGYCQSGDSNNANAIFRNVGNLLAKCTRGTSIKCANLHIGTLIKFFRLSRNVETVRQEFA